MNGLHTIRRKVYLSALVALFIAARAFPVCAAAVRIPFFLTEEGKEKQALECFVFGLLEKNEGHPAEALQLFEKALQKQTADNFALELQLGATCLQLKQFDKAEKHLLKAVALCPEDFQAKYLLAYYYTAQKDMVRAISMLQSILVYDPAHVPSLVMLAEVFLSEKCYDEAADQYQTIVDLSAAQIQDYYNLAVIRFKQKRYGEAATYFNAVVRRDPENLKSRFALVSIYDQQGDKKGVIEELEVLSALDPKNTLVCYNLASWYQLNGNYEKAITCLLKIIENDPAEVNAYVRVGVLYLRLQQLDAAYRYLSQAEKIDGSREEIVLYLALTLEGRGDYEAAIAYYSRAINFFSHEPHIYFSLGVLHDLVGSPEKAIEVFKKGLSVDPDHDLTLNYLGFMYAERGIYLDDAVAMLERAVAMKPQIAAYSDSLGWAYFKKGDLEKARTYLEKAFSLASKDAEIVEHLSDVYWAIGNYERALFFTGKARGLDPANTKLGEKIRLREKALFQK